jgi:hypothetical protein
VLTRSVLVLLLFAAVSVLVWQGWPALRPWFHRVDAEPSPWGEAAAARTEFPASPSEGGSSLEPTRERSARPPAFAGHADDAAFAPRHTRRSIELAAYLESVEPLPPGISPLPTSPTGPDTRTHDAGPWPAGLSSGSTVKVPRVAATPSEFVPLFHGVDLQGWEVHEGNAQAWQVVDGVIRCNRGGGGWLRSTRDYSDFELRFEYRLSPGANTGVGLRLPATGSPTAKGLEVQLIDDAAPKYANLRPDQYTGSLYYHVPPQQRLTLPTGAWHRCRILLHGDRIRVWINEQLVNDVDLRRSFGAPAGPALSDRPPLGRVGWQSSAAPVEFRDVLLRELLTTLPSGLRYTELVVGDGEVCPTGATVTVDYVGRFPDGGTFDNSRRQGTPVTLSLSQTIEGWQQGVPGMRVGGRRKLIVPPHLGYGAAGVPNRIPPQATLVFEVELRALAH